MKKRMLALLMAFVMVLGMLPGVSLTAHAETPLDGHEADCDDCTKTHFVIEKHFSSGKFNGHAYEYTESVWEQGIMFSYSSTSFAPNAAANDGKFYVEGADGIYRPCGEGAGDPLADVKTGLEAQDDDVCVFISEIVNESLQMVASGKTNVLNALNSFTNVSNVGGLGGMIGFSAGGKNYSLILNNSGHSYEEGTCKFCGKDEVSYDLDDVDEDVANIDSSECIYISGNGTKTATKTGVRMVLSTLTEVTDIAKTADGWTLKSGGVLYTIAHTESHSFENYVCTTCGTAVHGAMSSCTAHNDIHIGIYKVDASGLIYFDAFEGTSYYNSGTVGTNDFTIVGGQEPKPGMVLISGNSGFEVCSYATFKLLPQYCPHSEVKDEVCAACGKVFYSMPDTTESYSMLDTTESWVDTAETDASFRSSAPIDRFIRVEVDGNTIDSANYTVKEGSTIVTLKASYLKTLSVGKHTVSIVSSDGAQAEVKVTSEFTIKAGAPVPKTADPANNTLMLTLILGSALVLAMVALEDKKVRK